MTIRTVAGWAALALCATAPCAHAKQPAQRPAVVAYTVSGIVVDRDGNPISGADIALIERDSVRRSVRSDVEGRFHLEDIPTDTPTLRLRRLGYEPKMVSVRVPKADRVARVVLTLDPSVARLDPMIVADDSGAPMPDARMAGFYERARTNSFGHFVTPAKLAKQRPHYASEALQGIAGVTVRPSRIGNIVRLRGCGSASSSPERFGPVVWVDGVRAKGAELDEVTQGEDIAGIEVYNSMAGIPVQYFDRTAVCGTILVWTKSR
jgi:hypothetical protein